MTKRSVRYPPHSTDWKQIEPKPNPSRDVFSEEAIRAFVEKHLNEQTGPSEEMRGLKDRPGRAEGRREPEMAVAEPARRGFRLPRYQPKWSHTLIVLALTITLARPWLLPVLFPLVIAILVITYLTLGHDRAVEIMHAGFDRLAKRRPEMAHTLQQRAQRWSERLDWVAEHLPERWRYGLNLHGIPKQDELPAKMQQDPFERLARSLRDH